MDIMDRYEELKRQRVWHRNLSRVAPDQKLRGIHARHACECDVMISDLQQEVVRFIDGLGGV